MLLDDHDNPCLGHFLKIWCDKYAATGEVKGGTIPLLHRNFVVTSNQSIEDLYSAEKPDTIAAIKRRFKVIHMTDPFNVRKQQEEIAAINQELDEDEISMADIQACLSD